MLLVECGALVVNPFPPTCESQSASKNADFFVVIVGSLTQLVASWTLCVLSFGSGVCASCVVCVGSEGDGAGGSL